MKCNLVEFHFTIHFVQWLKWKCVAGRGGLRLRHRGVSPSPADYGVVRSPAGSGAEFGAFYLFCHRTHPVKEKFNLFIDILTQINLQL